MSKEDIMLLDKILNEGAVDINTPEVQALASKVALIVKQITTQEALNNIMLELNKLNTTEENK